MTARLSETDTVRERRDREHGYTLIEALVMLAITAIISVLVLDSIRISTSSGIRIERVAREAIHRSLDIGSLRSILGASIIEYRDAPTHSEGNSTTLTGYTAQGLGVSGHTGAEYSLHLEDDGPVKKLIYSEADTDWVVTSWQDADVRFEYWSPDDGGQWVDIWPQPIAPNQHYLPPPALMRIRTGEATPDGELVFVFPNSAPPPVRVGDILGQDYQ